MEEIKFALDTFYAIMSRYVDGGWFYNAGSRTSPEKRCI